MRLRSSSLIALIFILGACQNELGQANNTHSETKLSSAICNVLEYGATGDGRTTDTLTLQKAIDGCPKNGTVVLPRGHKFLSATLRLKSNLTLRIEPGSELRGIRDSAAYPDLLPNTDNNQLGNCRKALLYGEGLENITIEGALDAEAQHGLNANGKIDGGGENNPQWNGAEKSRPMVIFIVQSQHVIIKNIQVLNSGMWSVVNLENYDVLIDHVKVDSHSGPTRDGIDIVDCTKVLIQDSEILSEDDSICLKSGLSTAHLRSGVGDCNDDEPVRTGRASSLPDHCQLVGVHNLTAKNTVIKNSLVANAIKIGTATVGAFDSLRFVNIKIEAAKQAAMAVESVDGSVIHGVTFKQITFKNAGTAFFMVLGQRKGSGSMGSINNIFFEDINGATNLNWGSAFSGPKMAAGANKITNLSFKNVHLTNLTSGGLKTVPAPPSEYDGQYPDPRMWGALPAQGLYFRNIDRIQFIHSSINNAAGDPRPAIVQENVSGFKN